MNSAQFGAPGQTTSLDICISKIDIGRRIIYHCMLQNINKSENV